MATDQNKKHSYCSFTVTTNRPLANILRELCILKRRRSSDPWPEIDCRKRKILREDLHLLVLVTKGTRAFVGGIPADLPTVALTDQEPRIMAVDVFIPAVGRILAFTMTDMKIAATLNQAQ